MPRVSPSSRSSSPGPTRIASVAAWVGFSLVFLLAIPFVTACSPAPTDEGEPVAVREIAGEIQVRAEHPVTSPAAVEAGVHPEGGVEPGSLGAVPGAALGGGPDGAAAWVPVLTAVDMAESLGFYTAVLGFEVVAAEPSRPPFRRVELVRGGDGGPRLILITASAFEDEMGTESSPGVPGPSSTVDDEAPVSAEGSELEARSPGRPPPVLRLPVADLEGLATKIVAAGIEAAEWRVDGGAGTVPERLLVADPAGHRILLVAAGAMSPPGS